MNCLLMMLKTEISQKLPKLDLDLIASLGIVTGIKMY